MKILHELPSCGEYGELRAQAGWGTISAAAAECTLAATQHCVCARDGTALVGVVRILGDGCLFLFISELIVAPSHAGAGLGSALMEKAMQHVRACATENCTVVLVPISGKESFYERFGFRRTPHGPFGHGMAYVPHNASTD